MRKTLPSLCLMLLMGACGGSTEHTTGSAYYGQLQNDRFYGTVVSVNDQTHLGVPTVKMAQGDVRNLASTALSPSTSGVTSFLSGWFTSNSTAKLEQVNDVEYVIRKEDGGTVTILQTPQQYESILYPGQRALIQMNGDYLRVYPADVEYRH